jgi:uncharacterized repeat protein (TIGR01451 family)
MQLSMPQPSRSRFVNVVLLLALIFAGVLVPHADAALTGSPLLLHTPRAASTAPRILLVDDDTNDPDVRPYFAAALDGLGLAYDTWDTTTSNEPDNAALAKYATVIWAAGRNGYIDQAEAALADFLDQGHCLFISSQEYLYNRGSAPTPFMKQYLGVASATDDTAQTIVTGIGPVFGGIGPAILGLPLLYENRADRISPDTTATLAFSGLNPLPVDSGVQKDAGRYRTTYWGFGLESLPSAPEREDALQRVVNWCNFQADLSIQQTVSPAAVLRPGQPLTYTLSYKNDGVAIASGVLLTDTLPTQLRNLNITSSGPAISALAGAPGRWQIADMAPGASGIITITGVVDSGLAFDIADITTATLTTRVFDSSPANNSAQAAFNVVVPRLSFGSATYGAAEQDVTALINLKLDAPNPFADSGVAYTTSDGSAQAGSDYSARSGILIIPAGQASASFSVPIVDDAMPEAGETVLLSLGNASGATFAIPSIAALTILANDGIAPPQFTSLPPPDATHAMEYSHQFTASGLPQPSFMIDSGTLPPGLTLSPAGLLSGTPTQAGSYANISVTASNGMAPDATQVFSIVVDAPGANVYLPLVVR